MAGWFAVKRGITSHHLFKGQPERLAVWMWLMDNAAWKDTTHDVQGRSVTVPRGSVCASTRYIASEVGVGHQVVRTALERFKTEHMINTAVTHGKNLISLCNYEKYQNPEGMENTGGNTALTQQQHSANTQKKQGNKGTITTPYGVDGNAVDFTREVFDRGVAFLGKYGTPEPKARALIGKWRKDSSDSETFNALRDASREGVTEPVAWITARLKPKPAAFTPSFDLSKFEDQA